MDCRDLNSKIKVYHMSDCVNPVLGTDGQKPELLKTVWANVQPRTGSLLSGREAGTMLSKTTHVIKVRRKALKGIDDACWIEWVDGIGEKHTFKIDYILPPNKENFSTIYASEKVVHNGI